MIILNPFNVELLRIRRSGVRIFRGAPLNTKRLSVRSNTFQRLLFVIGVFYVLR